MVSLSQYFIFAQIEFKCFMIVFQYSKSISIASVRRGRNTRFSLIAQVFSNCAQSVPDLATIRDLLHTINLCFRILETRYIYICSFSLSFCF